MALASKLARRAHVLSPILQMLIAKQFKFILMDRHEISVPQRPPPWLRLEMKLTEDDMPAGR